MLADQRHGLAGLRDSAPFWAGGNAGKNCRNRVSRCARRWPATAPSVRSSSLPRIRYLYRKGVSVFARLFLLVLISSLQWPPIPELSITTSYPTKPVPIRADTHIPVGSSHYLFVIKLLFDQVSQGRCAAGLGSGPAVFPDRLGLFVLVLRLDRKHDGVVLAVDADELGLDVLTDRDHGMGVLHPLARKIGRADVAFHAVRQ